MRPGPTVFLRFHDRTWPRNLRSLPGEEPLSCTRLHKIPKPANLMVAAHCVQSDPDFLYRPAKINLDKLDEICCM